MNQHLPSPVATDQISFKRFLVALDASAPANRALEETLRLVDADGLITGIHAYAARLHDKRFRQMEGGLPERYRKEDEMEHQRDVHDDLITRGLTIISDSYHDAAEKACQDAKRNFARLSPEGKNYRRLVEAASSDAFDVLAMGSTGLGRIDWASVGSVCTRTVRRTPIDVLVIKDTGQSIGDGPLVVGIDGSAKSFAALKRAFEIGRRLNADIHAVAAYDPDYHYVAFNKIAQGLSEEQGKIFRFKEQERLHEELIDDGIARIYQSHLNVAARMAEDEGISLSTKLLQGKPHSTITAYLHTTGASLVLLGMTGIHADDGLDIGSCTENLLRTAPCHLWIGQGSFEPNEDVVARETVTWSDEAEAYLSRAPEFVRGIARQAVVRHAQSHGHTYITSNMVNEVMQRFMPERQPEATQNTPPSPPIEVAKDFPWSAAALARLAQVPEAVRAHVKARVEAKSREKSEDCVSLETCEQAFAEAREAMHGTMASGGHAPKGQS